MTMREKMIRTLINKLLEAYKRGEKLDKKKIERIKRECLREFRGLSFPSTSEILEYANEEEKRILIPLLRKKPVRSISGVSVVAVMTSPSKCPHGKCIFCPGGVNSCFGDVPQSYTGKEPATMRGLMFNFDPYLQTKARLEQFKKIGHPIDKIELIIMGGTFPARNIEYQDWFIKRCLDALNEKESKSLEEAQKINETAKHRCVALCVETRPDYCKEKDINQMLKLGTTRVEIGVQTIYNEILEFCKRGHTVEDSIKATQLLKDSGLKVSYHIMPGLPGSDIDKDKEMFKEIFENPDFRPDMVKIYPCLVIEGTELYELWKKGEYKPYREEEAIEVIAYAKSIMPKWVRTSRIQRDIPATVIVDGVKKSNLGELVYKYLEEKNIKCRCIRCREVGHVMYKRGIIPDLKHVKLCREEYEASNGVEIFLSFEDVKNDILIAFLRLREPYKPFRKEIDEKTMLVRQLHVCGPEKPLKGEFEELSLQHMGFGRKLLMEAERVAEEEFDKNKILVTSGIGVREYYRKLGYKRIGPYMGKVIKS
nr:tRNA uridine(34) 5-carboxymethylaminomethyl modification radical SAM/GNAT enzyme Elp3 [Methanocaldococcus villosus]